MIRVVVMLVSRLASQDLMLRTEVSIVKRCVEVSVVLLI